LDEKKEGLRPGIKNEWQNGLKNVRGTIAMARLGGNPDSATAQFFINVVDNTHGRQVDLDKPQPDGAAYAVFGKVVEGMETVDKIRDTAVTTNAKYAGGKDPVVPVEPVVIKSVRLVGAFDRAPVEANVKTAEAAAKETQAKANAEKAKELEAFIKKAEEEAKAKVVTNPSGLMYIDLKVGDGDTPKPTDKVEVHYTGWLVDGTKFDSSVDKGTPLTFSLTGGVIKGWLEGVATMKVGGKRKLIVPGDLAYGKQGRRPTIPADATLVFDVELLAIK
jgi:peptidylprolyl isomerase